MSDPVKNHGRNHRKGGPDAIPGIGGTIAWEDVGSGALAAAVLPMDQTTGNNLGPNVTTAATYSEDYLSWPGGMYQLQYPVEHFIIDPTYPNWITWPTEWADGGNNYAIYRATVSSELPYEPGVEPLALTERKYWDFKCTWGIGASPGSLSGSGWARTQPLSLESGSAFGSIRSDNTPAIPNEGSQYDIASDLTKSWQFCFRQGTGQGLRQGITFTLRQAHPGGAGDRQTQNMYHTLLIERIY